MNTKTSLKKPPLSDKQKKQAFAEGNVSVAKKSAESKERATVNINKKLIKPLKELCVANDISMKDFIEQAITEKMARMGS